eukprot:CAMPEP_0180039580 /NCGR_PEP_ID=MMETSP0984-20121128/32927_1 /TAXON_ID=483367 /ORGANISM="non described non described, Strain CCMP 2436" /LENGTH=78 /DNA_ID=CAMNT_0021966613 /DNA_START=625 /DNA_END=858 /DNA_ORIENTATION=+
MKDVLYAAPCAPGTGLAAHAVSLAQRGLIVLALHERRVVRRAHVRRGGRAIAAEQGGAAAGGGEGGIARVGEGMGVCV